MTTVRHTTAQAHGYKYPKMQAGLHETSIYTQRDHMDPALIDVSKSDGLFDGGHWGAVMRDVARDRDAPDAVVLTEACRIEEPELSPA